MLRRFFSRPSVHFWCLGLLIFLIDRWYQPAEVLSVDYPDAATVSDLRGQWLGSTGRPASETDIQRMVEYEIDQRILLAEALRLEVHRFDSVVQQRLLRDMRFMGDSEGASEVELLEKAYALELHLNDTVVKRRLIQAMESIYRAPGEAKQPDEAALEAIYQQRLEEFTLPATRKISHVFVSSDRHREETESRARNLYASFTKDNVDLGKARLSTDPFLSGLDFSHLSEKQLARHFGDTFAAEAYACPEAGWCGPIKSPYGWHLVWLHSVTEAKPQELQAVEKKVRYYFKREQGDEALKKKMLQLRDRYVVNAQPEASSTPEEAEQ